MRTSLNHHMVALFTPFHHPGFQPTIPNLGTLMCVVVKVLVFIHMLIQISTRCSNTFFIFEIDVKSSLESGVNYSLNHSVMVWFAHFHHL